ncbi:hypothetical protein BC629DRAFT_1441861 [Irpex lacteus]|nr:hypothetical protein BC629DRAFT_1441861 [Irpex lacteus]
MRCRWQMVNLNCKDVVDPPGASDQIYLHGWSSAPSDDRMSRKTQDLCENDIDRWLYFVRHSNPRSLQRGPEHIAFHFIHYTAAVPRFIAAFYTVRSHYVYHWSSTSSSSSLSARIRVSLASSSKLESFLPPPIRASPLLIQHLGLIAERWEFDNCPRRLCHCLYLRIIHPTLRSSGPPLDVGALSNMQPQCSSMLVVTFELQTAFGVVYELRMSVATDEAELTPPRMHAILRAATYAPDTARVSSDMNHAVLGPGITEGAFYVRPPLLAFTPPINLRMLSDRQIAMSNTGCLVSVIFIQTKLYLIAKTSTGDHLPASGPVSVDVPPAHAARSNIPSPVLVSVVIRSEVGSVINQLDRYLWLGHALCMACYSFYMDKNLSANATAGGIQTRKVGHVSSDPIAFAQEISGVPEQAHRRVQSPLTQQIPPGTFSLVEKPESLINVHSIVHQRPTTNVVVATVPEISIIARNDHKLEGDDLTVRGPKSCPLPSFLTGHPATQFLLVPANVERQPQHLMFAPVTGTLCYQLVSILSLEAHQTRPRDFEHIFTPRASPKHNSESLAIPYSTKIDRNRRWWKYVGPDMPAVVEHYLIPDPDVISPVTPP